MEYIKYHRWQKINDKIIIDVFNTPQFINTYNGWEDINHNTDNENEQQDIHNYFYKRNLECQIELYTNEDNIMKTVDLINRNEWIRTIEKQMGIEHPSHFIWVSGAENISGRIKLPKKNYKKLYYINHEKVEDIDNYYYEDDFICIDMSSFSGVGTEQDPWEITNQEDLQNIGTGNWSLDDYYIITNNINMQSDFNPLGKFYGSLNGQKHKIINFNINKLQSENIGLFSENGISGIIKNLYIEGDIKGKENTGAFAGTNAGFINKCSFEGNINGSDGEFFGGITGKNTGEIKHCFVNVIIDNEKRFQGGITGDNTHIISYCYATGKILGETARIGGLIGRNSGNVKHNYSNVEIIRQRKEIGGLVGYSTAGQDIDNYWDVEKSSQTTSAMGTGKTTSEMQNINTFTNWGISNINNWFPFYSNVTDASHNTITDSTKSWVTNSFKEYVIAILEGTGKNQNNTIYLNSSDSLSLTESWDIQPDVTSVYYVSPTWIISHNQEPKLWWEKDISIFDGNSLVTVNTDIDLVTIVDLQGISTTLCRTIADFDTVVELNIKSLVEANLTFPLVFINQPTNYILNKSKTKAVIRNEG